MPQFFFDYHDGSRHTVDVIGLNLATADAAINEALVALSQVMLLEGTRNDHRTVECDVRDAAGHLIYFAELILRGKRMDLKRVVAHGTLQDSSS